MHKHDIVAHIGVDIYARECAQARAAAPYTGQRDAPFVYDSTIPHEINDTIWYTDTTLTDDEKIGWLFAVYTDMPCYALLMEVPMHYDQQLSAQAKSFFWQQVRRFLAQDDDALAEPIAYLLWCDFFEFDDRCTVAWNEVTHETTNVNLLRRVLRVAGPVPFYLKEPLYTRLVQDRRWHLDIYESLRASYWDVNGQIDKMKALQILDQLVLSSARDDLQQLRRALQRSQNIT
jgi:hypothetical protein